jgi:hypothetical protein
VASIERCASQSGARASKKSTGSVDGIGRKAASRESKARITDRRTEADEVNYLADFPHPSRRESRWGACESISAIERKGS